MPRISSATVGSSIGFVLMVVLARPVVAQGFWTEAHAGPQATCADGFGYVGLSAVVYSRCDSPTSVARAEGAFQVGFQSARVLLSGTGPADAFVLNSFEYFWHFSGGFSATDVTFWLAIGGSNHTSGAPVGQAGAGWWGQVCGFDFALYYVCTNDETTEFVTPYLVKFSGRLNGASGAWLELYVEGDGSLGGGQGTLSASAAVKILGVQFFQDGVDVTSQAPAGYPGISLGAPTIVTPEPRGLILLGTGLLAMVLLRRRRGVGPDSWFRVDRGR